MHIKKKEKRNPFKSDLHTSLHISFLCTVGFCSILRLSILTGGGNMDSGNGMQSFTRQMTWCTLLARVIGGRIGFMHN